MVAGTYFTNEYVVIDVMMDLVDLVDCSEKLKIVNLWVFTIEVFFSLTLGYSR